MNVVIIVLAIICLVAYSSYKVEEDKNKSSKKKKPSLFDKEADAHGLTEEEKKIAKEQGYDVWDFEEDDDEDSYYSNN